MIASVVVCCSVLCVSMLICFVTQLIKTTGLGFKFYDVPSLRLQYTRFRDEERDLQHASWVGYFCICPFLFIPSNRTSVTS